MLVQLNTKWNVTKPEWEVGLGTTFVEYIFRRGGICEICEKASEILDSVYLDSYCDHVNHRRIFYNLV